MIIRKGSGTPWEDLYEYSRVVRVNQIVEVAGTTAMDGDQLIGEDNAYEQASFIFRKIAGALESVGSSMEHVVRTRMYVTSTEHSEAVTRAHAEAFRGIRPVATLLVVSAFINPELLVEIEASAVIPDSTSPGN